MEEKTPQRIKFGANVIQILSSASGSGSSGGKVVKPSVDSSPASTDSFVILSEPEKEPSIFQSEPPDSDATTIDGHPDALATQMATLGDEKSSLDSDIFSAEANTPMRSGPRYDPVVVSASSSDVLSQLGPEIITQLTDQVTTKVVTQMTSYDSSVFTNERNNSKKSEVTGNGRANRKRKCSDSDSENDRPAKKHISPEILQNQLEAIQTSQATMVQLLENTLKENKLIKEENKEIRNQLCSVEAQLSSVQQKLEDSLSRTVQIPAPANNTGKSFEIETASPMAPIQSTQIDEVNSEEVPNFVTKIHHPDTLADEIEEISSGSSTLVEEPVKKPVKKSVRPKPAISESDEESLPSKPTNKRKKLPNPPKESEIVDMSDDSMSSVPDEPEVKKPEVVDLDESVYSTPVEDVEEVEKKGNNDSLENIFETQKEEPKTLDLLRTQKSRMSTQKSRTSTEGTMRSLRTLYADDPEDVEETDDNLSGCMFDTASQPLSQPSEERPGSCASASTPLAPRAPSRSSGSRSGTPTLPVINLSAVYEESPDKIVELNTDDSLSDTVMVEEAMQQVQQSTRLEGSPKRNPAKSLNHVESPKRVLCDINRDSNKNNSNSAENSKKSQKVNPFSQYKFVIVLSSVGREHHKAVDKLCQRENGIKINSIHPGCTHVITKVTMEDEGSRHCSRTLKTLQGMAQGKWLIGIDWVHRSLLRPSGLCDEEDFEVSGDPQFGQTNGPKLSRKSRENKSAPLLARYSVYCHPPFDASLPKPSMVSLLKTMGATVFENPDDLRSARKSMKVPLILANVNQEDRSSPSQRKYFSHLNKLTEDCDAPAIARDWLLDTIVVHKIQPPKNYLIEN